MFERFGIERDDLRNLLVVVAIMTVVMLFQTDGPIVVRSITALIAGTISGLSFLVVTAVINAVKPDAW